MFGLVQHQLIYKVANAPLQDYPYPHIYVPDVFPADFYASLLAHIPDPSAMTSIAEVRSVLGYKERFVLDPSAAGSGVTEEQRRFWAGAHAMLTSGALRGALLSKFAATLRQRFGGASVAISEETLLVEDITNYALGPHTDSPSKAVTALFYLPRDDSLAHLGTSIYVPKEPGRRCPGGPHYPHDRFHRVATMPFRPNSMFAFVKTDNSFHGVEPVTDPDVRRWLLLYDIKARPAPAAPDGAPAHTGV